MGKQVIDIRRSEVTRDEAPAREGFVLYVGTKFLSVVRMDIKRFCPHLRLHVAETAEHALNHLSETVFQSIVLDDGVQESDVIELLSSLRFGTGINAGTPVGIIAPERPAWVTIVTRGFDNVLAIPNKESRTA